MILSPLPFSLELFLSTCAKEEVDRDLVLSSHAAIEVGSLSLYPSSREIELSLLPPSYQLDRKNN